MRSSFAIGIDLGGTQLKIGAVNTRGKILIKRILPTLSNISPQEFVCRVESVVRSLFLSSLNRKRCIGVGIGVPGLVNSQRGMVYYLVNIKGWENVPLVRLLSRRLSLPIWVDNDVNLMTLGEWIYGAGKGCQNLVCLTLGTGVGGGVVINGQLYRGASYSAGELGHVIIEENGKSCACGGFGCLEAYVGNRAIVSLAKGKFSSPKAITEAGGDRLALSIWEQVGTHLGIALTSVIHLLNPEKIVIGGGVANAGSRLFRIIRKTVRKRTMKGLAESVKIVKARLGEDAGIVGAAVLAEIQNQGAGNRGQRSAKPYPVP